MRNLHLVWALPFALLLFVFALGGAVGGFVAGYFWRRLITEKTGERGAASRTY